MALFRCASGGGAGGEITVTYGPDFYGATITCTRGLKVYSKTATSSGSVVFTVDEEGDWLIESTISGITYSVTASVTFMTTKELTAIPDGETVLPTDDIATWLLCADIKDKAYTTLSQVLGDSETYNALLGDSNASAYMARSTTWTTDICADQYAMNLLGQYDTACDALLSDATWTTALNNSSYWYGHTDSGVLIHGGNPTYDSFYRIVDGNDEPVTDPSLLDAGTYTIYSNGLAKDPDNLSNDYGKTVRICPNTKEIVVRPDNSLYWYGVMLNSCEDISTANGWSGTQASSLVSPVHNNTDITITCGSTQLGGIGSKFAVNTTTVKAVMQGVTASSGDYGSAGYQASKTTWDYATYSTKLTSNAITLVTYTGTGGSRFVTAKCNNSRKNIIYALWHE